MKRKLILPILAVALAVAGAFAKPMFSQMGWYDSNGAAAGGGLQGTITTPAGDTPVCSASGANICTVKVGVTTYHAFDSQSDAESGGGTGSTGLLKYN